MKRKSFDKDAFLLQNLNNEITPAALDRWKNLSYKIKIVVNLQRYQHNANLGNILNSLLGQFGIGLANSAISLDIENTSNSESN